MSGLEKKLITVIGKLVAHLKKEKLLPASLAGDINTALGDSDK
jgi:hypothetical protein|tara:strand:- start:269 stop:397 length:129 start_codon:yes stop_codon:yes gene_type:complete